PAPVTTPPSAAASARPTSVSLSARRRAFSRCSRKSRRRNVLRHGALRADRMQRGRQRGPFDFCIVVDDTPAPRRDRPMPFAYYAKLSPSRQRIYRKSDAIGVLELPAGVSAGVSVVRIRDGLATDDRAAVLRACQELVDLLVSGYRVPPLRV